LTNRPFTGSILYRKGCSLGHIQIVVGHKNTNTNGRFLKSPGLDQVRKVLEEKPKRPAKVVELRKKKFEAQ
jgi:hypothetical protein